MPGLILRGILRLNLVQVGNLNPPQGSPGTLLNPGRELNLETEKMSSLLFKDSDELASTFSDGQKVFFQNSF